MKKTDWFPGHVKPVRDGVYMRHYRTDFILYALYRDGKWRLAHPLLDVAAGEKDYSSHQSIPWRGLAEDPNKQ